MFSCLFNFFQLFSAQVKVARGQEKDRLKELHYDYVSDEEDCEGGRWSVRRPVWRSKTADALMAKLQQRINTDRVDDVRPRVPRVDGPPSERAKPKVLALGHWYRKNQEKMRMISKMRLTGKKWKMKVERSMSSPDNQKEGRLLTEGSEALTVKTLTVINPITLET